MHLNSCNTPTPSSQCHKYKSSCCVFVVFPCSPFRPSNPQCHSTTSRPPLSRYPPASTWRRPGPLPPCAEVLPARWTVTRRLFSARRLGDAASVDMDLFCCCCCCCCWPFFLSGDLSRSDFGVEADACAPGQLPSGSPFHRASMSATLGPQTSSPSARSSYSSVLIPPTVKSLWRVRHSSAMMAAEPSLDPRSWQKLRT